MIASMRSSRSERAGVGLGRALAFLLAYAAAIPLFAADKPANKSVEMLKRKPEKYAVAASLYWFARHQAEQGNWSLRDYTKQCKDKTCTGTAKQESLSAATALGLLPFLAAGQTQANDGPFKKTVKGSVDWLVSHQAASGDLSAGAPQQMYSHGLATFALSEDFGMTHDKTVGAAAQKAIDFIENSQNARTGGWRDHPGAKGDTLVLGWQIAALKSGQMSDLQVKPEVFQGAKRFLATVAKHSPDGKPNGQFSYHPGGDANAAMSAIGLLANQYLHTKQTDPSMIAGKAYLISHLPDEHSRKIYCWYYATQFMHNLRDKDWDIWNRKMRKALFDSQIREGCAAGSWDPEKPSTDAWGAAGGRLTVTSLSCLTLEVYYYRGFSGLPLYKLDKTP